VGSSGLRIISRGQVAIEQDLPGLDHDLTTVQIEDIPPQPHHFGAAESAECQSPRGGPLVLIGRGPELDQLERLPHATGRASLCCFLGALTLAATLIEIRPAVMPYARTWRTAPSVTTTSGV
jgi:hypothetical protein